MDKRLADLKEKQLMSSLMPTLPLLGEISTAEFKLHKQWDDDLRREIRDNKIDGTTNDEKSAQIRAYMKWSQMRHLPLPNTAIVSANQLHDHDDYVCFSVWHMKSGAVSVSAPYILAGDQLDAETSQAALQAQLERGAALSAQPKDSTRRWVFERNPLPDLRIDVAIQASRVVHAKYMRVVYETCAEFPLELVLLIGQYLYNF